MNFYANKCTFIDSFKHKANATVESVKVSNNVGLKLLCVKIDFSLSYDMCKKVGKS